MKSQDLSYFPEKNPNPVIEISFSGEIVYSNRAANDAFPDLAEKKLQHPVFTHIRKLISEKAHETESESDFKTTCEAADKFFDQKIYINHARQTALVYCSDITEQKKIEKDSERLALFSIQKLNPVFETDANSVELADQFGGPKGKKFKYKQFQEVLLQNAHLEPSLQKEKIRRIFSEWKGDLEQVDDVLVIGVRI